MDEEPQERVVVRNRMNKKWQCPYCLQRGVHNWLSGYINNARSHVMSNHPDIQPVPSCTEIYAQWRTEDIAPVIPMRNARAAVHHPRIQVVMQQ